MARFPSIMASLICSLSTGKGTWMKVMDIIKNYEWDNVFVITNDFGKEKFRIEKNLEFILVNNESDINTLKNQIKESLSGKLDDFEIALNIDSGNGKEHMALISALIQLGMSIRFVTVENNCLIEITPHEN